MKNILQINKIIEHENNNKRSSPSRIPITSNLQAIFFFLFNSF